MKIQSHELAMQSQHTISRVELETQISFSSFYTDTQIEPQETSSLDALNLEAEDTTCNYFKDSLRTIDAIIQNLLKMLQSKSQESSPEGEEKTFGYNHMSLTQHFEEHESLEFSTMGHIQTDKGSLDIDINFSMSRSFCIENCVDIYSSIDPLVINMQGDIPSLNTQSFSFDLDNDGKSDQISTLGSGSGFLALDKNNDGVINQGSELFGTLKGDGFGELSSYDEDSNNWIDENDSIFDKLQIWLKNEDENEKELVGLGEMGIGAIYLGSQQSEFTYKTQTNQTLGEMKSCGMFLNEDGSCGTISQIDFASREIDKNAKFDVAQAAANGDGNQSLAKLLQA